MTSLTSGSLLTRRASCLIFSISCRVSPIGIMCRQRYIMRTARVCLGMERVGSSKCFDANLLIFVVGIFLAHVRLAD
jgi:hypothetical protein